MDDPDDMPAASATDTHDFAPFIRTLGRGPGRSRSLTQREARHAFGMVLRGEAAREQVGALLMLLRYRGETIEEATGLVQAARAHAGLPWGIAVDLDWPSYADGRTRGLPWYLLSALLLAGTGMRVLMHGPLVGPGRLPLVAALGLLGIEPAADAVVVEARLNARGFAFAALEGFSPELADLLALRGVLGLRSPLNTVGRMLDPAGAAASIDGVFHPAYIALHLGVAAALGRAVAVLKGGGGEAEWSGAKALAVHGGGEVIWPQLADAGKPASVSAADMVAVWHGTACDPAGAAVVIGTAAVALHATGRALDPADAVRRARALWAARLEWLKSGWLGARWR